MGKGKRVAMIIEIIRSKMIAHLPAAAERLILQVGICIQLGKNCCTLAIPAAKIKVWSR